MGSEGDPVQVQGLRPMSALPVLMPAFILNEVHAKRGAGESHEQDVPPFALATTR